MVRMTLGSNEFSDETAAMQKAQRFFDRGRDVADAGNFDYAIDLFIHGLSLVPDDVSTHKELRLIALERKARGGHDISRFEKLKLRETIIARTDAKRTMLLAEKLLAFDPDDVESIKCCRECALQASLAHAAAWFARVEEETVQNAASAPAPKESFHRQESQSTPLHGHVDDGRSQ
jgi:hypothetical protein